MSFPKYPKYRASGVEWLGEVPEHWELKRLKHICTASPSNVDKKTHDGETVIRLCNYTDVYYNEFIVPTLEFMQASASDEQIAKFALRAGDTIITKDSETADDIGIAAYVPQNLPGVVCGYHLSIVRPRSSTVGAFVKWLLGSRYTKSCFAVSANGLTRVGLGQYELDNIELPIPRESEQRAIAAFLDRETAKIDALVAAQQRLIELLKEKRKAVISHAVTKGLDPTTPMKPSGIEWLGDVPNHWDVSQLKRLAGSKPRSFVDGDWIESPSITSDGIRLLQTGNIGTGVFKEQGYRYITEETFEQLGCTEVFPRDVLICRLDGPVGRACLAPDIGDRMVTSVDNAILKCGDHVVPEFVVALLSSGPWLEWIDASCRVGGGFRLRVSRSQLGDFRVPLPSNAEQQRISGACQRL